MRPRVLIVTHLFPTDARSMQGPWVAEQADALAAHVDVSVLCCSQYTADRSETRPSGVEVEFRRTANVLGHGRAGLLASTARYRRILDGYLRAHPGRYDVVHAHFGFPDAVVASHVTRRLGVPLVVTLHGDDAIKLLPRRDPLGRAVRQAVRAADTVICVSEAMADAVRSVLHAPVEVITNGYDDTLFCISPEPRDLGILFVGLLVPVKNIDLLLRAYASVRHRIVMPLTIVGDGPLRRQLEELSALLGLEPHVRFLGEKPRDQVAHLMQRATALVLPSSSEGWPLAVCEALACGTPVVASAVGGVPEIVRGPDAGILVPPGDVEALADALVRIASDPREPTAVAAASAARPWRTQAKVLEQVYLDVAARHREAHC